MGSHFNQNKLRYAFDLSDCIHFSLSIICLSVKYLMTITIFEEVNNAALISYRAVKTDQNTSYIQSYAMLF